MSSVQAQHLAAIHRPHKRGRGDEHDGTTKGKQTKIVTDGMHNIALSRCNLDYKTMSIWDASLDVFSRFLTFLTWRDLRSFEKIYSTKVHFELMFKIEKRETWGLTRFRESTWLSVKQLKPTSQTAASSDDSERLGAIRTALVRQFDKSLSFNCSAQDFYGATCCMSKARGVKSWTLRCRELDLTHCPNVSELDFIRLIEACPDLTTINLSRCYKISDSSVSRMVAVCPHLKSITLVDCPNVTAESVKKMSGTCLRGLAFSRISCSTHSLTELAKRCPRLKHIGLRSCDITDEGIIAFANQSDMLSSIDLSDCVAISDQTVRCLTNMLQNRLISIDLSGCKRVSGMSVLEIGSNCLFGIKFVGLRGCTGVDLLSIESMLERRDPQDLLTLIPPNIDHLNRLQQDYPHFNFTQDGHRDAAPTR